MCLEVCFHTNLGLCIRATGFVVNPTETGCSDYFTLLWNTVSTLHYILSFISSDSPQSLTIKLIYSVAMKSFCLLAHLWNSVSLPVQRDGPIYANAIPPSTALPSVLHQADGGSHPRGVANHRRLCCFSGIKPAPITTFSTGCPVAPTQDHSAGFQMWIPLFLKCLRMLGGGGVLLPM